jgi:hypothetical protein
VFPLWLEGGEVHGAGFYGREAKEERVTRPGGVVEAYYTPGHAAALLQFNERKIRDMAKAGDFTVKDGEEVLAEPFECAGEIRIPASGINHYIRTHPLRYDEVIKARNRGELMRKIKQQEGDHVG